MRWRQGGWAQRGLVPAWKGEVVHHRCVREPVRLQDPVLPGPVSALTLRFTKYIGLSHGITGTTGPIRSPSFLNEHKDLTNQQANSYLEFILEAHHPRYDRNSGLKTEPQALCPVRRYACNAVSKFEIAPRRYAWNTMPDPRTMNGIRMSVS
jgi:hypothetical protein